MTTTDDITAAIRDKWLASGLNALIPAARVYLGRAAEGTQLPYATAAVRLANAEPTAGPLMLLTFEASLDAYTLAAPAAGSVQGAMLSAFVGTADAPAAGLAVGSGRVVHSLLMPGDGTAVTQVRLDGGDINKVSTRLTILTQTTR